MSKHTPRPWHTGGVNLISVYGCDGIQLAVITDRDGATPADKANARLIAAAPDLLNALTHAVVLLHDLNPGTQAAEEVAIIITDALKKATS